KELGAHHVLVVHGKDGMDEISLGAATLVGELKDGEIREYEIHPEDFGMAMIATRNLRVADAAESKGRILGVLHNQPGPALEIVCLNAGAALYTANMVPDIASGIQLARQTIESGKALAKLDAFVQATNTL
ncbi:MAG: anthranilate phosphoribosyltransferase, partial [Rhodocyclaceae bacterium]